MSGEIICWYKIITETQTLLATWMVPSICDIWDASIRKMFKFSSFFVYILQHYKNKENKKSN